MQNQNQGRVWRPGLIITCGLLATLWVCSLFWGPVVPYWEELDREAFFALNGTLEWGGAWTVFWGHLNTRLFDVLWGVVMGLPLIWVLLRDDRWPLYERLSRVLLIGLSMVVAVMIAKKVGGAIGRFSPSDGLRPFLDVNNLVEGISAKTGSNDSFPGDHGVTAFVYFLGMAIFIRRLPLTLIAFVIVLANTTPRLIGGGHWLTDVIVGAVGFTLIVYPWMVGMPALDWLEKVTKPLTDRLLRPLLSRLGIPVRE